MRLTRYPDSVLRKTALPVKEFNNELLQLAREMFRVMYRHRGIGLAASQVGVLSRVIVVNHTGNKDDELSLVNPVILKTFGSQVGEEGCLSFPGIFAGIERPARIIGRAQNLSGKFVQFEAEGLLARIIAHEVDHLDGVLLPDRMSPADRIATKSALKKLERLYLKKAQSASP
jgi:peptide deformylase